MNTDNNTGNHHLPVMRPVEGRDFDQIHALAQLTGGGMTNLPMDKKALRQRIDHTLDSYARQVREPGDEVYMLVLEKDGQVIGTSATFSAIGLHSGFVNYRINTMFHFSEQLGKRISRRLLVPTHDLTGISEVGSLFISPDARGGGFGKLLARSRYMFIAQSPHLFADRVCAELRGWRADDGGQPFWEAVGKHFFDMDFESADQHNALSGNQFIADLMPIYPLYIALLPEAARNAIGKPHRNAEPAFNMLLKEGFEFKGYIDVFDAGPVVSVKIDDMVTVRDSTPLKVRVADDPAKQEDSRDMLLAAGAGPGFRSLRATASVNDENIEISPAVASRLNVDTGSTIRAIQW